MSEPRTQVPLVRGPFVKLPPHPKAMSSFDELRARRSEFGDLLAADLFCGAGGLSLGLSDAGFDVVLGIDHDPEALNTHRAYHPGLSIDLDLGDSAVVESVGELVRELGFALVAGGPPCQPFSRAGRSGMRDLVRRGKRPAHDTRRELWQSFLRIVAIGRPRAVLMENVPDMALDRDMWILRTMVDELEAMGYSVEERVVATRDYGVPQHRMRLIMVAVAGGARFEWPEPLETKVTVRNAIGDLPPVEGGWRPENGDGEDRVASGWAEYGEPQSSFQVKMREGVPRRHAHRIYDHITRPVREDDARAFAQMDSTTRYSDLDPELRRYRDDIFDDKYKRLDWDDLSRTITAHISKDGYWYIHPDQDRTITVREAARLQTFPDRVRFAGPPSAAFRQIGNAVPPALGRALGESIHSALAHPRSGPATTATVSRALADWWSANQPPSGIPWLAATTRWQVIHAEMVWSRIAKEQTASIKGIIEKHTSPESFLTDPGLKALGRFARRLGRESRLAELVRAAEWFTEHPGLLEPPAGIDAIRSCPMVPPNAAELAVRVLPGDAEDRPDPVLVSGGILRIAARFTGETEMEGRRKNSDGRLAVARMIGGEDHSHQAHLALFELAARVCTPTNWDCGHCPLAEWCHHARTHSYQEVLL